MSHLALQDVFCEYSVDNNSDKALNRLHHSPIWFHHINSLCINPQSAEAVSSLILTVTWEAIKLRLEKAPANKTSRLMFNLVNCCRDLFDLMGWPLCCDAQPSLLSLSATQCVCVWHKWGTPGRTSACHAFTVFIPVEGRSSATTRPLLHCFFFPFFHFQLCACSHQNTNLHTYALQQLKHYNCQQRPLETGSIGFRQGHYLTCSVSTNTSKALWVHISQPSSSLASSYKIPLD